MPVAPALAGYEPLDIWSSQPGSRDRGLREARQRIVVELRDRGATLEQIGEWFGKRKRSSVLEIERKGRELIRKEEGDG